MKTRYLKISMVLALCLTGMAVFIPSVGLGVDCATKPSRQTDKFNITAARVGSIDFSDPSGPANNPGAAAWSASSATEVELGYKIIADVNHMAADNDTFCGPAFGIRFLQVKAIHDGTKILFRIEFADPTPDTVINDPPLFHDALAVLVPYPTTLYPDEVNGKRCVPGYPPPKEKEIIHMGTPCNGNAEMPCCPVNIMFWRADKAEIENIVANSPGTTSETFETDEPGIFNVYQNWNNGSWTVVLGRVMIDPHSPQNAIPLPGPRQQADFPGRNMVDLVPDATLPIIFANWDGAGQERNGIKFIGTWGNLILQP